MCLGSALDILRAGQPPRATFVDYPLGHTTGKPFDASDQLGIVRAALAGFTSMQTAGEIQWLTNAWGDDGWRAEASSTRGQDTRQARDETPQFQFEADRDAVNVRGTL